MSTLLSARPEIVIFGLEAKYMGNVHMMPVEVHFKPSGKHWLGLCPSLDLITQGDTFEEAQENLREMLWLFIESCLRRGTLEQVLRKSGFTKETIGAVLEAAQTIDLNALVAAGAECRV
jgi:predicted RNase H-like HicB family nuclease